VEYHGIPRNAGRNASFEDEDDDEGRGRLTRSRSFPLLTNNLHQNPLPSSSVEFAIKNFFPRTEIEFAFGDGDHDFAAHDGPFQMRIRVILGPVMRVLVVGPFGANFSNQTSKSWCRPDSLSLIKTLAVICMAFTSSNPSRILLSRRHSFICGVIRKNSRRFLVSNQSSFR